jgi:hypothetical protein
VSVVGPAGKALARAVGLLACETVSDSVIAFHLARRHAGAALLTAAQPAFARNRNPAQDSYGGLGRATGKAVRDSLYGSTCLMKRQRRDSATHCCTS